MGNAEPWVRHLHTMNHTILDMSLQDVEYEVVESKNALEKQLGHEVRGFCYPNGDYDQRTIDVVKKIGFRYAVTTLPGNNVNFTNTYELRRYCPADAPLHKFVYSIHKLSWQWLQKKR